MRIVAAALLALMAMPLFAQTPDNGGSAEADPAVDAFFKFHDLDSNNKVGMDEVVTHIRAMFAELRGADEKKKAEIWKANEALITSRQFACADSNMTMQIVRWEWRAFLDKFAKDPNLKPDILQTATQARLEFYETGYDADENDSWSRTEAKDVSDADFKRYDTDNDQNVSLMEFIAARGAALRKELKYSEEEFASRSDGGALYRKVGRSWTLKSAYDMGAMKISSSMRNTVVGVTEREAEVEMVMLDDKQKETFKQTYKIPLRSDATTGTPAGMPNYKMDEQPDERIKVEAGEFDCMVIEIEMSGMKTKSYNARKYPGLMVKMVLTGENMNSTMELSEFIESPPAPDPRALYTKGRTWTVKVTDKQGDKEDVFFEKYEVAEVTGNQAQVDVTRLDKDMKPTDAPAVRRSVTLEGASAPAGKVTEERLEKLGVNAGSFDCHSITREDGGTTTSTSMHRAHGLVVKSTTTTEKGIRTEELWEFKE